MGVEQIRQRAHPVQVAVAEDTEVVAGLRRAQLRRLYQAITIHDVLDSLLRLDAEETGVLLQIQTGVLDVEFGFLHLALVFAPVEEGDADRRHDQPYPVIETLRVGERVAVGILRHPVQLDIAEVGIADRQSHGGQHIGARHLHLLLGRFHLFPQERKFRTLGNIRIHRRGRCDVHDRIRRHDLRLQRTTDDVAQG